MLRYAPNLYQKDEYDNTEAREDGDDLHARKYQRYQELQTDVSVVKLL